MSKDFYTRLTSRDVSKGEEMISNVYQISKKLEGKLNSDNAEEILFAANEFCEYLCIAPKNNPMITCANNCSIWKLKNKAFEFKNNGK